MKGKRIRNFNPGPAAMPLPVLEEIQENFLDFNGSGMSIIEISHRSKQFEEVINDAVARTRRLLNLGDNFHVLFLQGGASSTADYVDTGTWSAKAIKEAEIQGKSVNVVASSADRNYAYIPQNINFNHDAVFVHITSNNTIKGTQWGQFPDTKDLPIICDMSSDFMSRPLEAHQFGLIYAGAQKNVGPAGVCLAIIRNDLLDLVPDNLPTMLKYTTYAAKNSLYNTPPCFAIYTVDLVLKWLEETIGGLEQMAALNRKKASLLYNLLDAGGFYRATAEPASRSLMNITFRLPNEELEKQFIQQAQENSLGGLKGHRSVGGCRASLYNAVTVEAVEALVDFMKAFEKANG
ncbi:MAG: 3-phosphoserine/phosphohydroxythreonine transaminase [Desulfobacterales bacterium]